MKFLLLLGPILFVIIIMVLEGVTPNFDWKKNYVSELSLGKFGVVQRLNFVVSGILITVLMLFLASISGSSIAKFGWWAGVAVGLSMVSTGIWNTDVGQVSRTTSGIIHEWGYYLGVIGGALVCLLVAIGNRHSRFILMYSLIETVFAIYMIGWGGHWIKSGIYQRLLLYSMLLWLEVAAVWTMW